MCLDSVIYCWMFRTLCKVKKDAIAFDAAEVATQVHSGMFIAFDFVLILQK